MKVSVDKVAALAYLELKPEEKKEFQEHFDKVLDYVDQLQDVPMTDEEAKSMGAFHVQTAFYQSMNLSYRDVLRQDETQEDTERLVLKNSEALANAPQKSGLPNELLFEVPSIIDRS